MSSVGSPNIHVEFYLIDGLKLSLWASHSPPEDGIIWLLDVFYWLLCSWSVPGALWGVGWAGQCSLAGTGGGAGHMGAVGSSRYQLSWSISMAIGQKAWQLQIKVALFQGVMSMEPQGVQANRQTELGLGYCEFRLGFLLVEGHSPLWVCTGWGVPETMSVLSVSAEGPAWGNPDISLNTGTGCATTTLLLMKGTPSVIR